jgi:hypothetical protein
MKRRRHGQCHPQTALQTVTWPAPTTSFFEEEKLLVYVSFFDVSSTSSTIFKPKRASYLFLLMKPSFGSYHCM